MFFRLNFAVRPVLAALSIAGMLMCMSSSVTAAPNVSKQAPASSKKAIVEGKAKSPARVQAVMHVKAKKPIGQSTRPVKAVPGAASGGAASRAEFVRAVVPNQGSVGHRLGLHAIDDPLDLNSSVALVIDQDTDEVLFSKNDSAVLPIASLTKLMTGLVIADAGLDMNELITITRDDIDMVKGSRSRLAVGSRLSRAELMHLSLMSSENRAAHALGRTYPGGMRTFVRLMNAKAVELGMSDTQYVEPTGLSSENRSSARDLATLVSVAYERPMLRDLSTSTGYVVELGRRTVQYNNSNRLVRHPEWDIGLQKTGYISEAGRCLVMQARVAGRQLIMVFLDSKGNVSRLKDAERVRRWVEDQAGTVAEHVVRPQG